MISYIIEVSVCWGCFYLLYLCLLSKETFFGLNRIYLLTSLIIGLAIPFLDMSIPNAINPDLASYTIEPIIIGVQSLEYSFEEVVVTPVTHSISISVILFYIYCLGVVVLLSRFLYGLFQIFLLYKQGSIEYDTEGYYLIKTNHKHLPFSFFNYLFWSDDISFQSEESAQILQHEKAHINQKHSLDVLLIELISIFLWISPVVFLYKNAIRNVHEYLADAAVLQNISIKKYGHLLLKQTQSGQQLALANHFIHSQLKKRITMMTRDKSKRHSIIKYTLAIPLMMLMTLLFSTTDLMAQFSADNFKQELSALMKGYENQSNDEKLVTYEKIHDKIAITKKEYPTENATIESVIKEVLHINPPINNRSADSFNEGSEVVYKVVEEMPLFAGCADAETLKQSCSKKKLLEFVYNNIKYPEEARDKNIEGIVLVKFIVNDQGVVVKPEVIRSIGGGCDEAAMGVINKMPKWTPGKQKGENVNVYYHLPIKFKLSSNSEADSNDATNHQDDPSVYKVVDQMPYFPGCEEVADKEEKRLCANKKMINFIYTSVQYPKVAAKQGIEGTAVVRFIVDEAGNVLTPEIKRPVSKEIDEEVMRVMGLMQNLPQKWEPGIHKGEKVKVYFNLPVKFKLADDHKNKKPANVNASNANLLELESVNVFPNPASKQLTISFQAAAVSTKISLLDISGKEVFVDELTNFDGTYNRQVDLSKIAKGTLLLNIIQSDKIWSQKVIRN